MFIRSSNRSRRIQQILQSYLHHERKEEQPVHQKHHGLLLLLPPSHLRHRLPLQQDLLPTLQLRDQQVLATIRLQLDPVLVAHPEQCGVLHLPRFPISRHFLQFQLPHQELTTHRHPDAPLDNVGCCFQLLRLLFRVW